MLLLFPVTPQVSGLTEHVVTAPTGALNLLCNGGEFRAVGSTKMNETSSRSHAIFTIYIDRQSKSQKLVYNVYYICMETECKVH